MLLQGKNLPQAPEDSHEARIRCILQERGPVMQREDLFRIARAQGVSEAVVERGLSNSNVVVRLAKETYGLIGSSLGTVEPTLECSTPLCRKLFITRIAYYDIRGEQSAAFRFGPDFRDARL